LEKDETYLVLSNSSLPVFVSVVVEEEEEDEDEEEREGSASGSSVSVRCRFFPLTVLFSSLMLGIDDDDDEEEEVIVLVSSSSFLGRDKLVTEALRKELRCGAVIVKEGAGLLADMIKSN
jgi:hypothetical protein